MRGRHVWSIGTGVFVAGVCALSSATRVGGATGAGALPPAAIKSFSADVSVGRSRVEASGAVLGDRTPSPVAYHWDRTRVGGAWKTVTSMTSPPKPLVHTATGVREMEFPGV